MVPATRVSGAPSPHRLFRLSAFLVSVLLAVPPISAQESSGKDDDKRTIRRQRFDSLEEALTRAEVELRREHSFGVATVIYSARTPNDAPFRGRVEFRFVGPTSSGYIPGALSHEDYILQPVFVRRSTRAAELHIIVPGYARYVRRAILRHGDMVIWDDILLEPLTWRNTGVLAGRVWLEGEDEELGGIVISVDNEAQGFTDDDGYFVIRPVRVGTVSVVGTEPGYVGLSAEIKVEPGKEHPCVLVGHRRRFAHVRWAYQPDGTRTFDGDLERGEAVLMADNLRRVSFARGFKNVHSRSDFLVVQKDDRLVLRHFDVAGLGRPASVRVRDRDFYEIQTAPQSGYDRAERILRPGDVYIFRCYDGEHYGMMEVVDIADEKPVLDGFEREP